MTGKPLRVAVRTAQPAFYARTGGQVGDLVALLHAPYTVWHLSYVVFGAALAAELDLVRLGGALAAFFLGTGIAAHALDEWHSRPLGTGLPDGALLALGIGGLAGGAGVAIAGAFVVSPWALAWGAGGMVLAAGYALEWHRWLHADVTFGLAWGGFPVLVGYWAQAEGVGPAAVLVAGGATLLSLVQRALSKPARRVRREYLDAEVSLEAASGRERWPRERLLAMRV